MTFDITEFCSTDKTRPYLCVPFNSGGFTAATNGNILVRVPLMEAYAGNEGPPNFEKAVAGMDIPHEFGPLPPVNPKFETCPRCGGQRYVADCETCNGEGDTECSECGHSCECDDCHGKGYFPCGEGVEGSTHCDACMGNGTLPVERYVLINPTSCYDIRYLLMLQDLPGIMIAPRGENDPMIFKFDGGMGMLMPVSLSVKAVKLHAEDAA